MMRGLSVACGLALVVVAFIAGSQVADTREGLIAEVITLFAGLGAVALLLYGLVPRRREQSRAPNVSRPTRTLGRRTANDLVLGGAGIAVGVLLFAGLAVSGGWIWASLGGVLLIPMLAGSAYLLIAFARAPERDWTVDLPRIFRSRPPG